MSQFRKTTLGWLLTVILSLALWSCGSGGTDTGNSEDTGDDTAEGTGDASVDSVGNLEGTMDGVNTGIETGFGALDGGALIKAAIINVDETFTCETGSGAVSGTIDDATGDTDLTMTLTDCSGVTGEVSAVGTTTDNGDGTFTFDINVSTVDGLEGHGCTCMPDITGSGTIGADTADELFISGTLDSTCTIDGADVSVSCVWDNVSINDLDSLGAGCTII